MTTKAAFLGSTAAVFRTPALIPTLLRGPLVPLAPPDEAGGGGDGPMSRESAVEAIKAMEAPAPEAKPAPEVAAAPAEEEDEPNSEAAPTAEDDVDQEDPAIDAEEADETDQETPAIGRPRSWDAKDGAVFDALPDDAKAIIRRRENDRDRAVSKAQKEASDARKAAETEVGALQQLRPQIEGALDRVSKAYADRWDGVTEADWARWADENPEATIKLRFQFDADKAEKAKLQKAADAISQADLQKSAAAELAKLPEVCPPLADAKEGRANLQKLGTFLVESGIDPHQLASVTALELSLAWDAFQYRQLKARPPQTTNPAPAHRAPVRPVAAPSRSPSNDLARARNRLAQTGAREDAVEVIKRLGL